MTHDKTRADALATLISLSHDLGREDRRLSILGEGNTSVSLGGGRFLVKASGRSLGTLSPGDVVECDGPFLISKIDDESLDDAAVDRVLLDSRKNPGEPKPSVEALFHAWLLTLPGVSCVGHTHPVVVNQILCSPRAKEFAAGRMFPDEIVCCSEESVLVPYTDPGRRLAQGIRDGVRRFVETYGTAPRVVLLENHGLIAMGASAPAVMAATMMAVKAAEIFVGAAALGGPVFLSAANVARIANRPDEHYRRSELKI